MLERESEQKMLWNRRYIINTNKITRIMDTSSSPINASFDVQLRNDSLFILPKAEHKYTIVWLTGLDHHPSRFLKLFLEPPVVGLMENCRIVVPRPPNRETTIYGGRSCISWFDVKDRGENSFINPLKETVCVDHIFESEKLIEAVINEELKLVDENHLILGGFSQGCAMSLHMAFTMKKNWAGVISVAGYLFDVTPFDKNHQFPLKILHGTADPIRPWNFVKPSFERQGATVEFVEKMPHKYGGKEVKKRIAQFLSTIIKQEDTRQQ